MVHRPDADWTGRSPAAAHSRVIPLSVPPPSIAAHAEATAGPSAGCGVTWSPL